MGLTFMGLTFMGLTFWSSGVLGLSPLGAPKELSLPPRVLTLNPKQVEYFICVNTLTTSADVAEITEIMINGSIY